MIIVLGVIFFRPQPALACNHSCEGLEGDQFICWDGPDSCQTCQITCCGGQNCTPGVPYNQPIGKVTCGGTGVPGVNIKTILKPECQSIDGKDYCWGDGPSPGDGGSCYQPNRTWVSDGLTTISDSDGYVINHNNIVMQQAWHDPPVNVLAVPQQAYPWCTPLVAPINPWDYQCNSSSILPDRCQTYVSIPDGVYTYAPNTPATCNITKRPHIINTQYMYHAYDGDPVVHPYEYQAWNSGSQSDGCLGQGICNFAMSQTPLGTISGPGFCTGNTGCNATQGVPITLNGTANGNGNNLTQGQMFLTQYIKTNGLPVIESQYCGSDGTLCQSLPPGCSSWNNTKWCLLETKSFTGPTGNFNPVSQTFNTPGTYIAVVNINNQPPNETANYCSGNPFVLYPYLGRDLQFCGSTSFTKIIVSAPGAPTPTPTSGPTPTSAPTPTPTPYRVAGHVRNSQNPTIPIANVRVQVFNGSTSACLLTDASGYFSVAGFINPSGWYDVYLPTSPPSPSFPCSNNTIPPGYQAPPKTTTPNYDWNFTRNPHLPWDPLYDPTLPWGDQPVGSLFYQSQKLGTFDCAGPNDVGQYARCDFAYDPISPGLSTLKIIPDVVTGSVKGPTYGISGLRITEGGSNYYNAVQVTQSLDSNATNGNVVLVGTAFVSKTSPPLDTSLAELMRSADYKSGPINPENGFILLYANQDKTVGSQAFAAGNYYVYFKGGWHGPYQATLPNNYYQASEIYVTILGGGRAPQFSVTLYKAIGSHRWATYGYIMTDTGQQISSQEPAIDGTGNSF